MTILRRKTCPYRKAEKDYNHARNDRSKTMSEQLTYAGILELFREGQREIKEMRRAMKESAAEFDRRMQEADRRMKKTDERIGELTGSMGKVIERMVAGHNIIKQFQALGYKIERCSRNITFGHNLPDGKQGEIDLFLEDGDIAIVIEVKTTLKAKNVGKLMEKLERFRSDADMKGDKRRFVGAVAGTVVEGDAIEIAHENGIFVIVQSGNAVEILPTPEGFQAKEW